MVRLHVPLLLATAAAAVTADAELNSSDGLNADVLRSNESRRAVNDDVFSAKPAIRARGKKRDKKNVINYNCIVWLLIISNEIPFNQYFPENKLNTKNI